MNSAVHFSSKTDDWSTPPDFFAKVEAEFGPFDLDPCATAENAKAPKFYTKEEDGAAREWFGRVWCNPPYGRGIGRWIFSAWASTIHEAARAAKYRPMGVSLCDLVVMLLPARTDTMWWHDYIWDHQTHRPYDGVEVRFIKGRLRFGGAKNSAPFPSALVIFRRQN
jgi:phage N-6-adenine-methyltransferase